MDPFKQLRDKARQHRDKAIYAARAEYHETMRQLDALCRSLDRGLFRRFGNPEPLNDSLRGMTAIEAAEIVLREKQPLTLPEVVVEMQQRGCRSLDDPIRVAKAVRGSFYYHKSRFNRDADKRWSVLD